MLQFNKDYITKEKNISILVEQAMKILNKRKQLYKRYTRKLDNKSLKIPLEYYITNIASGFFGGKAPVYTVKQEINEEKISIIKKLFDRTIGTNDNAKEFQTMIGYIRNYNDDSSFFYDLVKDYLITNACYGLLYETKDNEIVYARVPSIQTVAIYDYSTPVQKIGLLRIWQESDSNGYKCNMVELITDEYKFYYKNSKKQPEEYEEIEEQRKKVKWLLVPAIAIENPDELGIFEPVTSLIDAFENIIKNNRNTFEYNDNAKLLITGFSPENPSTIENEDGKQIKNPARVKEDTTLLEAPIFYTPDATGKIEWIIKNINDTASENHKKTLIELILLISCIPNFNDLGFTKADNSSALEKKFFPLEQLLIQADKLFKKELLALWENITNRINKKKRTKFDFREIQIELIRNISFDKKEIVDMWLQLRPILSEETIINNLPFDLDVDSEIAKKNKEREVEYSKFPNENQDNNKIQDNISKGEINDKRASITKPLE